MISVSLTQLLSRNTVQPRHDMGSGAGKIGVMGLPVAEIRCKRFQSGNIPLTKSAKTLDLSAFNRQSWRYLYQFEALPVASVRFFERGEGVRSGAERRDYVTDLVAGNFLQCLWSARGWSRGLIIVQKEGGARYA